MKTKSLFFKAGLTLLLAMAFTVPAAGEDIRTIRIVTPSWEGQTGKDGTGLFFDIVRSVYEPVGIKMRYEFVPWKRAEKMLSSKEADAMLDVHRQNVGDEMLMPKYPMVVDYVVAVFKKGRFGWKGPESLSGKNAIWLRGYDLHKNPNMKGVNFGKREEVDEYRQAWGMLERDRTDVYLEVLVDVQAYISKNKIDMAPYQTETLWGEKGYMAFSKSEKSEKLIRIYDKRIIELFKSGKLKALFEKWGSYPFPPDAWKE